MTDNLTTKPTLDTLMDMMRELRDGLAKLEAKLDERLTRLEVRLDARLDRIESEVKLTHSEFYALRADFTELRAQLKEHLPAPK